MTNEDIFIYAIWTFIAAVAVVIIGLALYVGLRDRQKASLARWRLVKLVSSGLGIVGLALLMLSFDPLVRDYFRVQSREHSADRFYEAKFLLAHQLAVTCAKEMTDASRACGDLKNVDNGLSIDRVRAGDLLSPVTDWQRTAAVEPIADRLNRLIAEINVVSPTGVNRSPFSLKARIYIAFLAALLVILAIAGSVGEAAYQYRQAKDQASNTAT